MMKEMNSFIIGIAGGTGSGKSTVTRRLKRHFGDKLTVISHDDYYRAQNKLSFEERKKTNYDHPNALETDLLIKHLKLLKEGKSFDCPIYDFAQHDRLIETNRIDPTPVVIIEGILLFADSEILKLLDLKIFVESDADERILRRVGRDMRERGRDFNEIMDQYLTTVKPMHYKYVQPTRMDADLVLNGGKNDAAFEVLTCFINHILNKERQEV